MSLSSFCGLGPTRNALCSFSPFTTQDNVTSAFYTDPEHLKFNSLAQSDGGIQWCGQDWKPSHRVHPSELSAEDDQGHIQAFPCTPPLGTLCRKGWPLLAFTCIRAQQTQNWGRHPQVPSHQSASAKCCRGGSVGSRRRV